VDQHRLIKSSKHQSGKVEAPERASIKEVAKTQTKLDRQVPTFFSVSSANQKEQTETNLTKEERRSSTS
jgi:hypothetical protein